MESDLNIFALADELLLDFEPGLMEKISARLEKFIVADDVQIKFRIAVATVKPAVKK